MKERLAVYRDDGTFDHAIKGPGIGGRSFDVQIAGARKLVLYQNPDFSGAFSVVQAGMPTRLVHVIHKGIPVEHGDMSVSATGRVYLDIFPEGEGLDLAAVRISRSTNRAVAREVPGYQFLDGYLLRPWYKKERTLPLSVASTGSDWTRYVRFRLQQMRRGTKQKARGSVSSEIEIAADGTIHVLLHAGIYGRERNQEDGDWYLQVSPTGVVGHPVRLQAAMDVDDSMQNRHLALTSKDRPVAMWVRNWGMRIESLEELTSGS